MVKPLGLDGDPEPDSNSKLSEKFKSWSETRIYLKNTDQGVPDPAALYQIVHDLSKSDVANTSNGDAFATACISGCMEQ